MAGKSGRQALKRAALLALDDSRIALAREVSRVRVQYNPRELVRQSVSRHRYALMISAAVAGFAMMRLFMPSRGGGGGGRKASWRDRMTGLAATGLWSLVQEPVMNFAKTHLASYVQNFYDQNSPEPSE